MRTILNPATGLTWRLCPWNEACQMPVSTTLDGRDHYCRWHARCCNYPAQANDFDLFSQWLEGMQRAYPSPGWWGWEPERIWPVLQGVETIFVAASKAA